MATFTLTNDAWAQIISASPNDQTVQVTTGRARIALGQPHSQGTTIIDSTAPGTIINVPSGQSVFARPYSPGDVTLTPAVITSVVGVLQSKPSGYFEEDAVAALADPRRNKPSASLRQVTARVGFPNAISGGNATAGGRISTFSFVPLDSIQLAFHNGYSNSAVSSVETGAGSACTMFCSVEYPAGTFTQITWAGAASGVIPDNETGFTDIVKLPFTIPAYARFRIAMYQVWSGAGRSVSHSYSNCLDRANGDEYNSPSGNNYTMVSTPYTGTGSNNSAIMPALVLGYSNKIVYGVAGDSISRGVGDLPTPVPMMGGGLFARAMAATGPYINMAVPGERADRYILNSAKRRAIMAAGGMDRAFLQLGINDGSAGRTSAQILADRVTIRGLLGVPVYDTTLTPNTSSSDAYVANQTPKTGEADRLAVNVALRAGVGLTGCFGVIDTAAPVETDTATQSAPVLGGGLWIQRYAYGTGADGIHPTNAAHEAITPIILRFLNLAT